MGETAAIERLAILDGGFARVEDGSIYSPGINVGMPMMLSCNAYLIRHHGEWMMWDTGTPDALLAEPGGKVIAHGIRGIVGRTVASQLEALGVRADEVGMIAFSHGHYDHVGNSRMFRRARWVVQRREHEAMFGDHPDRYGYIPELYEAMRDNETQLVDGDHDMFGDGAVRMIATPGHTLGHCSLLLRLPDTGAVLLSGDVAHNRCNLQHRRVPSLNADHDATLDSMDRVEKLCEVQGAVIWINHDTEQSATLSHAPAWIT